MKKIIEIENLSFSYDKRDFVLKNVSFHVDEKDFIYIVGPNGGGKSTLMKILLGLLQPTDGQIKILGKTPSKARKEVGYMPQHLYFDFDFPLTVFELVKLGLTKKGFKRSIENQMVEEALKKVRMEEFSDTLLKNLSGGQRQRAFIARSMVSHPKILILDEPTANVDHEVAMNLMTILKELKNQTTVLMVSHDYRFVSDMAAKVFCVDKTVAVHPTVEISENLIKDIFKQNVKMVQHHVCIEDHDHSKHGHKKE